MPRSPHIFAKLSVSLVFAVSVAASGVARANPIPTSTDEARALAVQVPTTQSTRAAAPLDRAIFSTDEARALTGRSLPASPGAWVEPMIARNTDEARAAAVAGHQVLIEKEPLAVSTAGASPAERGN